MDAERDEGGSGGAGDGGPADGGRRAYLEPYERAVGEHGATFKATLWQNEQKQVDRFRVLSEMVDLRGRRVLDAGCGIGDFGVWLAGSSVGVAGYVGIDGVVGLIEGARGRGIVGARFFVRDFAGDGDAFEVEGWPGRRADVITFSGSLNTFEAAGARSVLERAWASCGEALAFNFLSGRPRPGRRDGGDGRPAWRFDPLEMLDWALDLTPRVRFRQDYFDGHDATIVMERVDG